MLGNGKTLLAKAYTKQEELEEMRQKVRGLEKTYEGMKKEFTALVKEIEADGKAEDSFHKLMYEEESKRAINKIKFLEAFGQEKFNEAAKIGVTDAEAAVGKNAVTNTPDIVVDKKTTRPIILKF